MLAEVAQTFLKLGLTSFGGPVAHIGFIRTECVEKRQWLDDAHFADLVALCQFLPGPASSQLVFALGMHRAGLAGALLASFCFTLPSAVAMIAFAYGVLSLGDLENAGWLHGLKLAAVPVVAQAVWSMGRKLCPDLPRALLAASCAGLLVSFTGVFMQVAVIALGALAGWAIYGRMSSSTSSPHDSDHRPHPAAGTALAAYAALLALIPLVAHLTGLEEVRQFNAFYRAGSLVFGGGHVVLPLLRAELVPYGWLTDDQFLAGYGAVQAVPGPLFTFAAYLGAVMHPGPLAWLTGSLALLGVLLPAWLLVGGTLPFWHRLRARPWAQAAMSGANASVVGVLGAALVRPVFTEGVHTAYDGALALFAFALLEQARVPAWAIVLALGAVAQWVLPGLP